jgi:hypothetical protein
LRAAGVVIGDVLLAAGLFCFYAVLCVAVYRAAFPARDEDAAAQLDPRPRRRCPHCGGMVLPQARLCRFCGYRYAPPLNR